MKKLTLLLLTLVCSMGMFASNWYINGNAAPQGWSDNNGVNQIRAFTPQGDGIYTWIGKLYTGGEGFKIGKNDSGFGGWGDIHPSTGGLNIEETGTDTMKNGGDDTKWTISNEGIYKLTINENDMTLKCEAYTPALTPNADGVYEIGTAAELAEFAELVSHDAIDAKASVVLTADIDYTAYPYTCIGRGQNVAYAGTFNGQGHKITVALKDWLERTGLFAYVYGVTIKNLWVDGDITMSSHNCAGGLGGRSDGDGARVDGVLSTVTINDPDQSGDGTYGGLFANVENNDVIISNCAFLGSINAPSRDGNGGIVGWCGSGSNLTIKNCLVKPASISWNGGASVGRNKPTISNVYAFDIENGSFEYNGSFGATPSDEQMANGEFCYWLNESVSGAEHWYQTIGTDANPFPVATGHSKVYANGDFQCDGKTSKGTTTYSNEEGSTVDPHTYGDNGVCTVCGAGQEPAAVDGVYQIANVGNLVWFSNYVNAGATTAEAVLTADIDQTGVVYTPIGSSENVYKGKFDGQNHSVTLALDNTPYNNQGLFGVITDGVDIENVIVKGYVKGNNYVGGIAGATNGGSSNAQKTMIKNCGNEATITAASANAGGIIGVNMSGSASFHFENVYNTGEIHSGWEGGAMSGWSGGGWSYFVNCYNAGKVYNGDSQSADFTRHGGTSINNCYFLADCGTNAQEGVVEVSAEQMASGEVCVALGEAFTQNIGTDTYPTFGHSKVYDYGNSTYGNEAPVTSPYAGAEAPAEETQYFLYNVRTGKWLGDNDRNSVYGWTSHAEIGDRGRLFGIVPEDGGYRIDPHMNNNRSLIKGGLWMDTNNPVTIWTLTPATVPGINTPVYKITSGDQRLATNAAGDMDENNTYNTEWMLVSSEERMKVETANASEENPAVLGWAINGGNFTVADGYWDTDWEKTFDGGNNVNGGDGNSPYYKCNRARESWNSSSYDFHTVVKNLPNGKYTLNLQGYYRDGSIQDFGTKHTDGTEVLRAKYYANDKEATLQSIIAGGADEKSDNRYYYNADGKWVPDGLQAASAIFFEGGYWNEPLTFYVTDGTATLGCKKEGDSANGNWTVVDNFTISYYGESYPLTFSVEGADEMCDEWGVYANLQKLEYPYEEPYEFAKDTPISVGGICIDALHTMVVTVNGEKVADDAFDPDTKVYTFSLAQPTDIKVAFKQNYTLNFSADYDEMCDVWGVYADGQKLEYPYDNDNPYTFVEGTQISVGGMCIDGDVMHQMIVTINGVEVPADAFDPDTKVYTFTLAQDTDIKIAFKQSYTLDFAVEGADEMCDEWGVYADYQKLEYPYEDPYTFYEGTTISVGGICVDYLHDLTVYVNDEKVENTEGEMGAFQYSFPLAQNTTVKVVFSDKVVDGINDINNTADAPVYNIAGQRLNATRRGINIINGKKVLK